VTPKGVTTLEFLDAEEEEELRDHKKNILSFVKKSIFGLHNVRLADKLLKNFLDNKEAVL